jgi:large subunit ribosomal protein L4
MNVDTYNQAGEKLGTTVLPKDIFGKEFNSDLIHQVVVGMQSNKRQGNAHTKTKGEVRGGGKKPWRQKGTGRARHGSSRSPIWIGGGVTFGPRNDRNFKKILPIKMRRSAMFSLLSKRVEDLIILDSIKLDKISTKAINTIFVDLFTKLEKGTLKSVLFICDRDDIILKSVRNIPGIDIVETRNLNVLEVATHKHLVFTKDSLKTLKETFTK